MNLLFKEINREPNNKSLDIDFIQGFIIRIKKKSSLASVNSILEATR
ncbi:hypothetical protein [Irregularibacter muris]|nr:hypothetical protein [Irregularibacter muris]